MYLQLLSHPSISGSLTMAYLPSLGEVTAMKQRGLMTPDKLRQVCYTMVCITRLEGRLGGHGYVSLWCALHT